MAEVRCIHRKRNKIGFFEDHLVKDPHWRKQTGWEPQALPQAEQPEQFPVTPPDELHKAPLQANPPKRRGRQPKVK